MIWNVTNTILAVLALALGGVAVYYARKQVVLIRLEQQRRNQQEDLGAEWAARADEVIRRLVVLVPRWSNGGDGVPAGPLYPMVLPEPELRAAVETHLIIRNGERATARTLTLDQMQNALVRETVQHVEEQFDAVRRDSPVLAAKARLVG